MYLTPYTAMRLPMIPMIRAMMMENWSMKRLFAAWRLPVNDVSRYTISAA